LIGNSRTILGAQGHLATLGEHGQDQDWISCCRIQDTCDFYWVWIIAVFLKKIGWGQNQDICLISIRNFSESDSTCHKWWWWCFVCYGFYIHTKNQNDHVSMCCTHHNQW